MAEQRLSHPKVRTGEPALRGCLEVAARPAEIHGRAPRPEQLGNVVDGRVEGVGERELGDCLTDDREQRATPLELL